MKQTLLYFIAPLLLFTTGSYAQQKEFTSSAEAVKFINETCIKYWLVNAKDGDISREITVYQNGCQLFFNEKSVIKGKGPDETKVNNTLISINLRRTKMSGNYATLEFTGGKKDIVTIITDGNSINHSKPQYSNRYRVAVDYTNQLLKNNLYDLTTAASFLLNQCHAKHAKHTKKKRVTKK